MLEARPATEIDVLDFPGARGFGRRAMVFAIRNYAVEIISKRGEPLALVAMHWQRKRRVEIAFLFAPAASGHMVDLSRMAQLTLARLAQDGIMAFARIRQTDGRAQRMARLSGFSPSRLADKTIWVNRRPDE